MTTRPTFKEVRKLDGEWKGEAYLWSVYWGDPKERYYFIASRVVPFPEAADYGLPVSPVECLVFPATEDGEIKDWCEVAGGKNMTFAEAKTHLMAKIIKYGLEKVWSNDE